MDLVKKFIKSCERQDRYSENTMKNYQVVYGQFTRFLDTIDKQITDVTREEIECFIEYLREKNGGKITTNTVNLKLGALESLYDYLLDLDFVPKNPVTNIRRKVPDVENVVALTEKEVNKLINAAETERDKAILSLLFVSGCRISELVNINRDDIYELPPEISKKDGVQIHIRHSKNYQDRVIVVPRLYFRKVSIYLRDREDDLKPLFLSSRNKRIHPDTIRYIIEKAIKKAKIKKKVTPHTFRKTCLTYLINKGVDILTVSKHAGHSNVGITDTHYTKAALKMRAQKTLSAFE